MNPVSDAPGWHGKLPSLGDFASRRLGADFIEPWDDWLATGLLALREADPEGWLQAYLASPSWRFLLLPGALPGAAGAQAWAGVLMPSVDRVGRYFPLSLVQPLGGGPATTAQMHALWQWLGRLDELARDALFDDWTADRLEQELAQMAGPPQPVLAAQDLLAEPVAVAGGSEWPPLQGRDAAAVIGARAQGLWWAQAWGQTWWHAQPDDAPPQVLRCDGLPSALGRLFGQAATIGA